MADPASPKVETPLGQQTQSRHRPAESPNGSSPDVGQVLERPTTADAIQASRNMAVRLESETLTRGFIPLSLGARIDPDRGKISQIRRQNELARQPDMTRSGLSDVSSPHE
jgi:hypothetical protein